MDYNKFIQPKDVEIGTRTFCVSKIPAIPAQAIYAGVAKYVTDNGIIGITMLDRNLIKEILQYTAIRESGGSWSELDTESRINDTFVEHRDMLLLVSKMIQENFGFLMDGSLPELLAIPAAEADSEAS